ncbi:hypothetical protein ACH419_36825 [Streptomyces bobili]|uniref:hypothetical protein n=1 Tax=Streptomyces bobili TaxID=67280 RepID=UPI0037947416
MFASKKHCLVAMARNFLVAGGLHDKGDDGMATEATCRSAQRGLALARGRADTAESRLRTQERKLQELRDQGAPAAAIEAQERSVESAQLGWEGHLEVVEDWGKMVEEACAD